MPSRADHAVIPLSRPAHVKTIKRRFTALNNERLSRAREALRPEQRVFMDVLPLLLHINQPALPGFVSKKTPAGIADFSAGKRTLEAANRLVKKFSYRRRAMRVYNIHGLYMIGSSGTVAYSDKSDFDVWVCHRPGLSESLVELLRAKCEEIRRWAATVGLDTKFFVMDPSRLRSGATEALSDENSGSAQHLLLLEEFYRTGLLVAGRYPAWWLVPPDREADYQGHLKRLIDRGLVYDHEFIDFGDVTCIPAEEFFGASLWQLHKAIDSPYKSVLKLLLMEAYTAEYPNTDLLCTRFKRAVYSGETDLGNLDPYVLMIQKVEEYLGKRREGERLDLARKCFYFKVNEKLSERGPRFPDSRREVMSALAEQWGWSHDRLLILDSRATWKIHRVMEERKALVDELTRSYRMVSEFARRHARSNNINSRDLNLLGRRLYAEFERKAGKVEIINPGISTNLTEERLSFVQVREQGREGWLLVRGEYDPGAHGRRSPLKRAHSLIELVAWCHFNRLIGLQTLVTLHNAEGTLSPRELLSLIDSLRRLFPEGALPGSDMERLRQPAYVSSSALYINLGLDPLSGHTRKGLHLTSNRSDALSYGGIWKNLALTFDLLLITSWREVLTFRYSGAGALLDCLCDYLAWTPLSGGSAPRPVPVHSFSTTRGMAIAHRVEELFRDAVQAFYGGARGPATRYIVRIEHDYHMLQAENDVPRHRHIGGEADLVRVLGEAQDRFSPVVFDRYAIEGLRLAYMLEQNRPGVVQLFYHVRDAQADVYVLDEKGSLFHQLVHYHDQACLIGQYQRYLESAIGRCNATEHDPDGANISTQVEFYRLKNNRTGQLYIESVKNLPAAASGEYLSIQVIGDPIGDDPNLFSLYCEGREFSALEYADKLFEEVARYVLAHRQSGQDYPIYITDADVSRTQLGADGALNLQTVHYLDYKKRIERQLNAALDRIRARR